MNKYKCIFCKNEDITFLCDAQDLKTGWKHPDFGLPRYYRIVNEVYTWYCGPICVQGHHNMGYKPVDEVEHE